MCVDFFHLVSGVLSGSVVVVVDQVSSLNRLNNSSELTMFIRAVTTLIIANVIICTAYVFKMGTMLIRLTGKMVTRLRRASVRPRLWSISENAYNS